MIKNLLSPSLICLNPLDLRSEIRQLEEGGADMLHVDFLDGHFSPSMPLGFDLAREIRKITDLPFDVHVMVSEGFDCYDDLLKLNPYQITFQLETLNHPFVTLQKFIDNGSKVGVALKPGTPISDLEYLLDYCDVVLQMAIEPGFASHNVESIPGIARKLHDLRMMINCRGLSTQIELDGRVSTQVMTELKDTVNIFVCGSRCLDKNDLKGSIENARKFIN